MNSKNIDTFKNTLDLVKALKNLTDELADLEIKGLKDTEEYKSLSQIVKDANVFIFKSLKTINNFEDLESVTNIIVNMLNINMDKLDSLSTLFEDDSNEIGLAMYNRIIEHSLYNSIVKIQDITDYFKSYDNHGNEIVDYEALRKEKEIINKEVEEDNQAIILRQDLIYNSYMKILIDEINKEVNIEMKNKLIKLKYKLMMASSNLGFGFVKNPNRISRVEILKELLNIRANENVENYEDLYINVIYNILKEVVTMYAIVLTNDEKDEFLIKCYKMYIESLYTILYATDKKHKIIKYIDEISKDFEMTGNEKDNIIQLKKDIEEKETLYPIKKVIKKKQSIDPITIRFM